MITVKYLREALSYDPATGILTWREDRPRSHFSSARAWSNYKSRDAGRVAGAVNSEGYLTVRVGGVGLLSHRVAYSMHYGIEMSDMPRQIDHEDRDGQNNRIDNLRAATNNNNMHNRGMNTNNTSGFKGVSWHKQHEKWMAKIKVNGKSIHLGYFTNPEEASDARRVAANQLHGEFARHATYLDNAA